MAAQAQVRCFLLVFCCICCFPFGNFVLPHLCKAFCFALQVLVSTAGPFARYGSNVVAACVDKGTHYTDITGEIAWVKRMIETHHETAVSCLHRDQ